MLIDMHAHSSGISRCCKMTFEETAAEAKKKGIDGVVLTNHYQRLYIKDGDADGFVERYIGEFLSAEKYGRATAFKVFFGIEVTMDLYPNVHMLIYGVEPEFLRRYPLVFEMTQAELYQLVRENGGVLIQAHPFRNGTTVLDTEYLDGVEINCHPLYLKSYSEQLQVIARENGLILSCGGDFHADTYRPKCGMILPDDVEGSGGIKNYLLSESEKILYIQEPNTEELVVIRTER